MGVLKQLTAADAPIHRTDPARPDSTQPKHNPKILTVAIHHDRGRTPVQRLWSADLTAPNGERE